MRFMNFAGLTVALLSTLAGPVLAQDAPTVAASRVLPYDQLRQILPLATLGENPVQEVRTRSAELDGQIVELGGAVIGTVVNGQQQRVVMEISNRTTLLLTDPDLDSSYLAALKSGSFARVLARVQLATSGGDAQLRILAATNKAAPPVTSTLPAAPTETEILQLDDDTIALPPLASMRLPENKPEIALIQTTSATAAADNLAQFVATYKDAHKAVVRRHNKKLTDAQVEEIAVALLTAGYKHNMDPRFLAAIIAVESDFNIYSLSKSGAMGLGQLMPFNLKEAGVTNPWNPTQNIMGAAKLLRGHLDDYKGRADATLLAVAAYNAGPGAVRRAGYKVPNGAQVQRYVWKVYYRYKAFAPDMFN